MTLSSTVRKATDLAASSRSGLRNLRRTHPGLFIVMVFTLVTRIAIYVFGQPWNEDVIANTILSGDGAQYNEIAVGLLNGVPLIETIPNAGRTFGYPFFVTVLYAISNNAIWLVLAAQTLINFLMVPMVYWIARRVFDSQRAGTFAAGLFALSAISVAWATRYLFTETLFALMLLVFVIAFLLLWRRDSFRWFLLLGVLLGLGSHVRAILQYFVVIPVLIVMLQDRSMRKKLILASALVIGLLAMLAPWQLRNSIEYGHYSLSTNGGNVLVQSIVRVQARVDGTDFYTAFDDMG